MAAGEVVAVVGHLYVVHAVRYQIAQLFVIDFGGELKRPVLNFEAVVHADDELQ